MAVKLLIGVFSQKIFSAAICNLLNKNNEKKKKKKKKFKKEKKYFFTSVSF